MHRRRRDGISNEPGLISVQRWVANIKHPPGLKWLRHLAHPGKLWLGRGDPFLRTREMKLPDADRVIIPAEKVRDYLLSPVIHGPEGKPRSSKRLASN